MTSLTYLGEVLVERIMSAKKSMTREEAIEMIKEHPDELDDIIYGYKNVNGKKS